MADSIRKLIWLYFFTLMVEGVLRKWLVPGLSNELLLIREPIVLAAYFLAFSENRFPHEKPVLLALCLGIVSFVISIVFLEVPLFVAMFGFKASFLHIPMILLIPRYFNREDVIRMGVWVLLFSIPNSILMVLQFGADYGHRLNAAAGGSPGQLEGAMGRIRPPGLFSFITGAAQFIALTFAFVMFGLLNRGYYTRRVLYVVLFLLLLSLVVSISRLAIGGVLLVMTSVLVISLSSGNHQMKVLARVAIPLLVIGFLATRMEIFAEGQEAFESRLMRTGDYDAGVGGAAINWYQRTLNDLTGGLYLLDNVRFFGEGLGLGTNVAARFLTGKLQFMLAEGEWARVVLELGPFLGLGILLVRVAIVIHMLRLSLRALHAGNQLPVLLFGASFLLVLTGQWGQSTTLGFATLGAGLTFAATRVNPTDGSRRKV